MSRMGLVGAIVACLLLFTACRLGPTRAPSITVASLQTNTGPALRVIGKDWPSGERVVIGLAPPDSQPTDSEAVATALTDASGSFVALFLLPADERWNQMPQIWIVAHSGGFSKVGVATLSQVPRVTATPTPHSAPSATLPSLSAYVLGYVENVVASSGIIKVKPVEGQAEVIVFTESTQFLQQGQPAQLADIRIGDLVEASGRVPQGEDDRIIAEYIRILTQATAEPTITPTATTSPIAWQGEYYNNTTFSGNPLLIRDDPVIDFQWGGASPAEGLPADSFAVRWTGSWPFEVGFYRFHAQVNDGVRLWLDEHLIIDQWHQSVGALFSADAYLSAGLHTVRVEYFEAQGDAHVRVWWDYRGPDTVQTYPNWKGEYYSNMTLSGAPFLVVNERLLDFDWGESVPASGMPDDNFSVRWTRTVNLEEGIYGFYARSDDGVRLWVDETQVIDQWQDGEAATYSGEAYLPSGDHSIRVEYYENTGLAVIKVWWELLPATPTPTSTPTSTHTPTPVPTHTPVLPTPTPTQTAQETPLTPEATPQSTPMSQPSSLFVAYFPEVRSPLWKDRSLRSTECRRLGGPAADL